MQFIENVFFGLVVWGVLYAIVWPLALVISCVIPSRPRPYIDHARELAEMEAADKKMMDDYAKLWGG